MEGFVCDRCETFHDELLVGRRAFTSVDLNERMHRTIRFGYLTTHEESKTVRTTVDLCGDCRRELAEWIGQDVEKRAAMGELDVGVDA